MSCGTFSRKAWINHKRRKSMRSSDFSESENGEKMILDVVEEVLSTVESNGSSDDQYFLDETQDQTAFKKCI